MTSNSWPIKKPPLKSSSTHSTPCTTTINKLCSLPICHLSSCQDSKSVFVLVSNGVLQQTSSHRILKPELRSWRKRPIQKVSLCPKTHWNTSLHASIPTFVNWKVL